MSLAVLPAPVQVPNITPVANAFGDTPPIAPNTYRSLAEIKLIAPPPGKFVPGRILIAARAVMLSRMR